MKNYNPTLPITIENWPAGLKMPPLRHSQQQAEPKAMKVPKIAADKAAEEKTSSFSFFA
ncbi:MAG TPA: hypothetical protein VGB85_04840 [Nannocystis sp.]